MSPSLSSFIHQHDDVVMCCPRLLVQLAKDDPPVFMCHFYNIYFAHTAGGRMIGTKIASMLLDSWELNFYKVGYGYHCMQETQHDMPGSIR